MRLAERCIAKHSSAVPQWRCIPGTNQHKFASHYSQTQSTWVWQPRRDYHATAATQQVRLVCRGPLVGQHPCTVDGSMPPFGTPQDSESFAHWAGRWVGQQLGREANACAVHDVQRLQAGGSPQVTDGKFQVSQLSAFSSRCMGCCWCKPCHVCDLYPAAIHPQQGCWDCPCPSHANFAAS